jgi:hypothetical protein
VFEKIQRMIRNRETETDVLESATIVD